MSFLLKFSETWCASFCGVSIVIGGEKNELTDQWHGDAKKL